MLKIGLTGGIGSGKSTVTDIFSRLGVTVIDADLIAHQLSQSDGECFNEIKQLFGDDFINDDGELNRKKIAETIFSNPHLKADLEKTLHPRIRQQIRLRVKQAKQEPYIILAIPLLFESNFTDLVDRIIVVDADEEIRIRRIQQRDNRTEEQIKKIISSQSDREQRLRLADDILYNNDDLNGLQNAVNQLHHKYFKIGK